MPSTFFGISVAQSGLAAQRMAIDILGYNIANANDPTYRRQRIVMAENAILAQSQEASTLGSSPFGAGVSAGGVERIRDTLIENRIRHATQASAAWHYMSQTMSQIEATIAEPSDSGLQTDLDQFWASWQKVATTPDSVSIRGALLEDATALCERIQYEYMQMRNISDDLNAAVVDRVDKVNLICEEIARLNSEIGALESGQVPVNDLQNRRDALVVELSKLASVSQHGEGRDNFVISIGGRVLIQGSRFNPLRAEVTIGGSKEIQWAADGEKLNNSSGELSAIVDLRDRVIPGYLSQLDNMASTLTREVNALHRTGYTLTGARGGDFFRPGGTAGNISLDPGILGKPELVAASSDGALGDGEIAASIAGLKESAVADGLTINQMYRALVGEIGGTAAIAERQSVAHQLSLDQFTTQQQSVSGVSLDEEMTNMIKFQQAYNASARILTVMDEMLGVLISQTGAVGR